MVRRMCKLAQINNLRIRIDADEILDVNDSYHILQGVLAEWVSGVFLLLHHLKALTQRLVHMEECNVAAWNHHTTANHVVKLEHTLNQLVFDRPNVNIIIMDGKNFVLLTEETYDIIMTDSIYPGTGGASALYTYDHFRAVSDKLKVGGIASCWLPLDLSPEDLRIALKAFYDAFPNMSVWYCYMTFSQHALLIGKKLYDQDICGSAAPAPFQGSGIRPTTHRGDDHGLPAAPNGLDFVHPGTGCLFVASTSHPWDRPA